MGFLPGKTNEFIGGHQPEINVPAGNPLSGLKGMKRPMYITVLCLKLSISLQDTGMVPV